MIEFNQPRESTDNSAAESCSCYEHEDVKRKQVSANTDEDHYDDQYDIVDDDDPFPAQHINEPWDDQKG